MASRPRGLALIALLAGLAACSGRAEVPTVNVSPQRDAGPDTSGESDAAAIDASADAASPRGDTPKWPEAEQEVELSLGGPAVTLLLVVEASPSALDLHLNVDTTASMRFAIDELQGALRETVIQRLHARVADVAFGVSRYADFPREPFGAEGPGDEADQAFVLLSAVTTDVNRVMRAVTRLDQPLGMGADVLEAGAESLYQVATGAGYRSGNDRLIDAWSRTAASGGGSLGGVGFRDHALHVVLHVADSPSHTPADYAEGGLANTHAMSDAIAALREVGARAVSILPTTCQSAECRAGHPLYGPTRSELSELALATGASLAPEREHCATGIEQTPLPTYEGRCPLVFDAREDGTGVSRTITDAVLALLEDVRFGEVHAEMTDDRLQFIESVRAKEVSQTSSVRIPELSDRLPAGAPDGIADSHLQVEPRSRLGFEVTLRNRRIAARDVTQRFRVAVRVLGDGILLEERLLRVIIPAARGAGEPAIPGAPPLEPDQDAGH